MTHCLLVMSDSFFSLFSREWTYLHQPQIQLVTVATALWKKNIRCWRIECNAQNTCRNYLLSELSLVFFRFCGFFFHKIDIWCIAERIMDSIENCAVAKTISKRRRRPERTGACLVSQLRVLQLFPWNNDHMSTPQIVRFWYLTKQIHTFFSFRHTGRQKNPARNWLLSFVGFCILESLSRWLPPRSDKIVTSGKLNLTRLNLRPNDCIFPFSSFLDFIQTKTSFAHWIIWNFHNSSKRQT